jgi:hypothetical protein
MATTYRRFSVGVVEEYLAGQGSLTMAGVDHSMVPYWLKRYHAGELSLPRLCEQESVETTQHIAALERKGGSSPWSSTC